MTQLVWLRNDLRILDNPALYHACQTGQAVRVIFCVTKTQWQAHDESPRQLALRQALLAQLAISLANHAIDLEILETTTFDKVPELIHQYCNKHNIQDLWFNRQSWLNEALRDSCVENLLTAGHIKVHSFCDELLVDDKLLTQTGQPYRVFTPWYRQWLKKLQAREIRLLPAPSLLDCASPASKASKARATKQAISAPHVAPPEISLRTSSHLALTNACYRHDIWPSNAQYCLDQLRHFCQHRAASYPHQREFPSINGTSLLSPYLAVGALSIRQCYYYLQQSLRESNLHSSIDACANNWPDHSWLKELGWREFYRYLMINNPNLAKGETFNPAKEPKWVDNPVQFEAWCQGETGYPLIDAAMRQLHQTGWMHNRLRMLSASFLCKLLLIDWRKGERFFNQQLLDADFSSNNGGWQWSASVGCDAAPWFRIFNPILQSRKFDAQGDFIRKMLPQLSSLSNKDIHWPSDKQRASLGYCAPIINYAASRQRALNWLK